MKVDRKKTLKDFMPEVDDTKTSNSGEVDNSTETKVFEFDESFNGKLETYNDNIETLDPAYTALKAQSKVLVRCYVNTLEKDENGIIKPNHTSVAMPTQSGLRYVGEIESPYPFSKKAVVVSAPEYMTNIKVGDKVILAGEPVRGIASGSGDNAKIEIPTAFLHPFLSSSNDITTDPENRMYGYLAVLAKDIDFVLDDKSYKEVINDSDMVPTGVL